MRIFKGPKTLSIMPTWSCPAECKDCGTLSSPRVKQHLTLDAMLDAIEKAKQSGFHNVVFTGGEPTLRWNDLLIAIKKAKGLGFPTRIVTNAHWATNEQIAKEKVAKLIDAGLDEINFSTGDEHNRFIPIERIINGIVASVFQNLRAYLMIELKSERKITKETILNHPRIISLSETERKLFDLSESPWMPLNYNEIEKYPEGLTINRENIALRTGCDSILQTYVIESDGKIGSCCGLGMRLIPELCVGEVEIGENYLQKSIDAAENDILKLWIHYKGPERIIEWASEKDPKIKWEDMYAHRCQACSRMYKDDKIRKVIKEHYQEMIAEIIHCAFLEEEYLPEKMGRSIKSYRRLDNSTIIEGTL
ncbi:MAG: radical SAM protein [Candidatus Kapabacteria bacterium]|jgi:organic radical activating enzyme|nr:radical SAM protein [Candidatus Kapabacteria bacterium]MCB0536355.1 radical SAM protein [Bacteroidota bacterium]